MVNEESETMFKKRHDMYVNSLKEKEKNFGNYTQYNDFTNSNDYNSTYKVRDKKKISENKMTNISANIDVKVRKKVKTAGENTYESLFNTTFGSLHQISHQIPLTFSSNRMENTVFHRTYVDPCTPTLPCLDTQSVKREDQPMPLPIPKNDEKYSGHEYTYTNFHLKAKSS
mmetsp:Transcript_27190/g.31362  ORF Transcript_27190/g.31362 Transcript_27190/m.31362 type:complete len:171 (-) Transcript_27190:448-960(-)